MFVSIVQNVGSFNTVLDIKKNFLNKLVWFLIYFKIAYRKMNVLNFKYRSENII